MAKAIYVGPCPLHSPGRKGCKHCEAHWKHECEARKRGARKSGYVTYREQAEHQRLVNEAMRSWPAPPRMRDYVIEAIVEV